MNKLNFENIFFDSLDTFKVFDNLSVEQANETAANTPKSVWQILNHLVCWQQYQLKLIEGNTVDDINETDTWETMPVEDPELVNSVVSVLMGQIDAVKAVISSLTLSTPQLEEKLKHIQDLISHLSFHLGEIILIRRQMKNYPWPHEMTAFLASS